MPEDMSEKDVKKYVGKGCQKICQTRMSEDAPERMSIEMSEHLSDKNVKRYCMSEEVSIEMSEICQIRLSKHMSEEMPDKNVRRYVNKNARKNARNCVSKGC